MAALVILSASCDTCPQGNATNSLFCHGQCAADEATCSGVCANLANDRDNCGTCGNACGDGLVCAFSQCVEPCEGGLINCAGACVDLGSDEANCGGCAVTDPGFACSPTETCSDGQCGCLATELVCAAGCIDPNTSNVHCGATGDCTGLNAGTQCVGQEACLNGNCESTLIYRGSLADPSGEPAGSTGLWTFNGQIGITGANAACAAAFPGSEVCTFAKLQAASTKAIPETINAVDTNNNPVSAWWIDDPTLATNTVPNLRCSSCTGGDPAACINVPFSYGTADQGVVGQHVTLTRATGAISNVITQTTANGCSVRRHVACCSVITAP